MNQKEAFSQIMKQLTGVISPEGINNIGEANKTRLTFKGPRAKEADKERLNAVIDEQIDGIDPYYIREGLFHIVRIVQQVIKDDP